MLFFANSIKSLWIDKISKDRKKEEKERREEWREGGRQRGKKISR